MLRSFVLLPVLSLALALPAAALRVDGVEFADRLQLAGSELRLNGVGFRAEAWLKGYAAALYLDGNASTPAQLLAHAGPKRLQMRMLLDVGTDEFVKAFHKGVQRNTPPAQREALAARMARFDAVLRGIGKVRKGDVIDLDWLPGRGLQVSVNGQVRGESIPGADFYAALLRIFVGERPVDDELKIGLLGGPPR